MKSGFEIVNDSQSNSIFFIVANYENLNEVCTYGFINYSSALLMKSRHDLGIWQPKGTNKNNKPKQL